MYGRDHPRCQKWVTRRYGDHMGRKLEVLGATVRRMRLAMEAFSLLYGNVGLSEDGDRDELNDDGSDERKPDDKVPGDSEHTCTGLCSLESTVEFGNRHRECCPSRSSPVIAVQSGHLYRAKAG